MRWNFLLLLTTASLPAAEFRFGEQKITVPDGFTVELAAGPEIVARPVEASFDDRGRLYVTEASGTNAKVEKQLAEKPHRVLRLTDADGDGVFEQRTVFADGLMLPQGCLWHAGALYVSAAPQIWKLTDTDDDGVADRREVWFDGVTLTGCANDLHGPYLGPDGWIYWCKGAFAEQRHMLASGKEFKSRAAHVFRRRPEGGPLEPVITAGMDNPVGLAWTPAGALLLSGTFFLNPAGGQRDGLFHAVYGGVWGKVHDVLTGHPRTAPGLMPVMTHLGAAAPCGFAHLESTALGFRDQLMTACFNLHKVTRHELLPQGASFSTRDTDFVVSDATDFHPTDVLEDADGSLLVIDTGGWYKLCCPTSQLAKPDVLGAIYRVRRTGSAPVVDPRGLREEWAKADAGSLAARLGDARPVVRQRAVQALAERGAVAVPALASVREKSADSTARLNAVWALGGNPAPEASGTVLAALTDADDAVRVAALHVLGLARDRAAAASVLPLLTAPSAPVQRAAAEALGRMGDPAAVAPLRALTTDDRFLDHSRQYALLELGEPGPAIHLAAVAEPRQKSPAANLPPVPTSQPLPPGDAAAQRARLATLSAALAGGDTRRGQALFNSAKAACASCHAIGYLGGTLGPDLTGIGKIRTTQDLLEAIAYPSTSFVRSYESVIVKTKAGGEFLGIVRGEGEAQLRLALGPGVEHSVPLAEVAAREPAAVSLMPQGYDGILSPQELADLVAFLRAAQ